MHFVQLPTVVFDILTKKTETTIESARTMDGKQWTAKNVYTPLFATSAENTEKRIVKNKD